MEPFLETLLLVARDDILELTIDWALEVLITLSTSFLPSFMGQGSFVISNYLILKPCYADTPVRWTSLLVLIQLFLM